MHFREDTPDDADAICSVVTAAFGRPLEAQLVRALQVAGDAVISLVAEENAHIIAHALLSRMIAPFPALALAPVSVAPARQREGIGSALVREILHRAEATNHWRAVFVLGDPRFYSRFGFSAPAAAGFSSPYAGEYFMGLALAGVMPATKGALVHAPAFASI